MKVRILLLTIIAMCFSGCLGTVTKCCDFVDSYTISKGLYVEKYRTFYAGVFGELTECYLTDSINFRHKIGSYDEHDRFYAEQLGDKIFTYNFQSLSIPDTTDRKTISKTELWQQHHSDTTCLFTTPVFGKNTITCDKDFYPASSYKTDDGYYMSEIQYRCGNDYSNAVFYTDSLNFCVLVGVYIPGSFANHYSIKVNNNNTFDFFNIAFISKVDTVKSETFLLTDIQKGSLIKVCK